VSQIYKTHGVKNLMFLGTRERYLL